jgi:hypothetical protein
LNVGGSYSYNRSDLNFSTETNDIESNRSRLLTDGNYINFKAVLERKINRISAVRGGFELNNTDEKLNLGGSKTLQRPDFGSFCRNRSGIQ